MGICEGLVNNAITQLFGFYILGRPSFVGDVVGIDRINDTIMLAHCQCPINPHGNDRAPYIIRSHTLQKDNKMLPEDYPEAGPSLSAAVQVELPTNEIVTATKMSLYDKKIAVSTGLSVSGNELYQNFEDILCRTKVVMKTDSAAFEQNYDTAVFGVHRNIFFGDHTQILKDLGKVMGFEVVQESEETESRGYKHEKYGSSRDQRRHHAKNIHGVYNVGPYGRVSNFPTLPPCNGDRVKR